MYSNFEFIKEENRDLYILGKSIESQMAEAPSAVLCEATTFLDNILYSIYEKENIPLEHTTFGERCEKLGTLNIISDSFKVFLQKTFDLRNKMHSKMTTAEEYLKENKGRAKRITKRLFKATWLYYEYLGHTNEEMPKYVSPQDLDKQFDEVENCIICGEPTEFDSFYCEECGKVKTHINHLNYFYRKYGYYQLFSAQDIGTIGYSKDELDVLLPELVDNNLLFEFNESYGINLKEHEKLQETVEKYEEIENLYKKFYWNQMNIFQLRNTETYQKGKLFQEPYESFSDFVDKQFMKKFLDECKSDKSLKEINKSNLISKEDMIKLVKRESPVLLSKLRCEFLEYRKDGVSKETINADLLIDDETYELLEKKVGDELNSLLVQESFYKDLLNGKYYDEALKDNNLTSEEVHRFIQSNPEFKNNMKIIMNRRRRLLFKSLNKGLKTALDAAKITETQLNEEFSEDTYDEINEILKEKFCHGIKMGDTSKQAMESCEVSESWVNRWMNDSEFKSKVEDLKAKNLMNCLQSEIKLEEALKSADIIDDETKNNILAREEFTTIIRNNESLLANKELKELFKHYKMSNFSQDHIQELLSIDDEAYRYLSSILFSDIIQERKDIYYNALLEDYSYEDALKEAGLTVEKVIEYRKEDSEFKMNLDKIFEKRQEILLNSLENNGFETSLKKSGLCKIQIKKLFKAKNHNSFYSDVNTILKANYLELIKNQVSSEEALAICEVDETWLSNWMDDLDFKEEINKINEVNLLRLLKNNENLEPALKQTGITRKQFYCFVCKGFNNNSEYEEFFKVYSERIFPEDFSKFLDIFSDNNEEKALKKAGIDKNIFLYELKNDKIFYDAYLKSKQCKYVEKAVIKGHSFAFKYSGLSEEEFLKNKVKLMNFVDQRKMDMLIYEIEKNNKNPYQALKQIDLKIEDVYRMYHTGIYSGEYEEFAMEFERVFIDPIMAKIQYLMDCEKLSPIKALKFVKNEGMSSKLNEMGEVNRNNRRIKRNLSLKRGNPKANSMTDNGIKRGLTLSKDDIDLWKKYHIIDTYIYRSVLIKTVSIPDMASC